MLPCCRVTAWCIRLCRHAQCYAVMPVMPLGVVARQVDNLPDIVDNDPLTETSVSMKHRNIW